MIFQVLIIHSNAMPPNQIEEHSQDGATNSVSSQDCFDAIDSGYFDMRKLTECITEKSKRAEPHDSGSQLPHFSSSTGIDAELTGLLKNALKKVFQS